MADLTGRTAIVTGGATLLAHGVVQALHEGGAAWMADHRSRADMAQKSS